MFNNMPSCASQNSIEIISSNMDLPSSSSSSSTFLRGGRALDRHNPIITDEKRSGGTSKPGTPVGTPCTHTILQHKPITSSSSDEPKVVSATQNITRKKKGDKSPFVRMNYNNNTKKIVSTKSNSIENNHNNKDDENNDDVGIRKSISSKPSDLIMKATAECKSSRDGGVDYYSPTETSSRYLLDDSSFLEVLSEFDPVHKHGDVSKLDQSSVTPSGSTDQVVVLSVSLHCRGCERKMKKHLSRMPGVTSFNIDFAAKKVTVIGDVTPLEVLASISKVKTAKLWAPAMPSTTQISSRNIEVKM